jgi:dolichol-phosphate mannosyltransferase
MPLGAPSNPPAQPRPAPVRPGPALVAEAALLVADFAALEDAVRSGTDSARIAVLATHAADEVLAAANAGMAAGRGPLPVRAHACPWRTLVVVPTYNERDNLEPLVAAIHAYLDVDILIVDDGSPDGTGALADQLAAHDPRVRVQHRQGKQGLGTAYLAGFATAIAEGYERVCEMDADFSHPPWDLPRLVFASEEAELVIGSRYVRGGCTVGWTAWRRLLSRGANLYARLLLGAHLQDMTAGFRCYHTAALCRLDLAKVSAQGYGFQIEMAWRMLRAGCRVQEVPIHFVDRRVGKSKMSGAIAREALLLVPRLRRKVPRSG